MNRYNIDINNRSLNDLRGDYDTTLITVDSQVNSVWSGFGVQTIDPTTTLSNGKSNAGFVCILNNPLLLDNNFEYVCCVSKVSFDISNYASNVWTSFNVNLDAIAYQYYDGGMQQVLHKTVPVKNTGNLSTGYFNPFSDEPRNLIFRFLNPSNKILSRLTFQITDSTGQPLNSTDPLFSTQIQLVIKKVTKTQQY
jgi:hypothetical protein